MAALLGGLFIATVVTGVIPVMSAELLVVAAAVAVPGIGWVLVTVTATLGQMTGKTGLFALARWAPEKLPARARGPLRRASEKLATRQGSIGALVLASAVIGLPPLYGMSLACGALRVRWATFIVPGVVGRAMRFGFLAYLGYTIGPGVLEMFS